MKTIFSENVYVPSECSFTMLEKKPSKIKGFLIGFAVIALLTFVMTMSLLHAVGGKSNLEDNIEWLQVEVASGDTMWDLVSSNNPASPVDLRELIYIATKQNGSDNLQAGHVIDIPVYKEVRDR